jgi:hypothetical protein
VDETQRGPAASDQVIFNQDSRPMIKSSLALALAVVAAGSVAAQTPAPKQSDIAPQLIGIWEGPYQSEAVGPGTLKLTVAKGGVDNKEWQVTLEIFSDQPPQAGPIRNFAVAADSVSWEQTVGDYECSSKATLVAGVLKGNAECYQAGALALTAGFLLEKKKPS